MAYILLAVMVIAAAVVLAKAAQGPQGGSLMPMVQLAGGLVLCCLSVLLAFGGPRFLLLAIPLGAIGLALILNRQKNPALPAGGPAPGGRYSEVRTQWLDMVLDHGSGAMTGTVRDGTYQGRRLETLTEEEALALYAEASGDPQSVQVLDAFLDRTFEGWRDRASGAGDAGATQSMTREVALGVLGLSEGASDEEIRTAHRDLMKKLHPDQGGSTVLATQINAAKDFLLGE